MYMLLPTSTSFVLLLVGKPLSSLFDVDAKGDVNKGRSSGNASRLPNSKATPQRHHQSGL